MLTRIVNWFGRIWNVRVRRFWNGNYAAIQQASPENENAECVTNICYPVHSDEDVYPCTGRGLCIIIANFIGECPETAHLKGYIHDKKHLVGLFEEELDFDVIVQTKTRKLENLSLIEFQEALKELQDEVQERFEKAGQINKYDRFFMFVLSHGGENGLCTCQPGSLGERFEYDNDFYLC